MNIATIGPPTLLSALLALLGANGTLQLAALARGVDRTANLVQLTLRLAVAAGAVTLADGWYALPTASPAPALTAHRRRHTRRVRKAPALTAHRKRHTHRVREAPPFRGDIAAPFHCERKDRTVTDDECYDGYLDAEALELRSPCRGCPVGLARRRAHGREAGG